MCVGMGEYKSGPRDVRLVLHSIHQLLPQSVLTKRKEGKDVIIQFLTNCAYSLSSIKFILSKFKVKSSLQTNLQKIVSWISILAFVSVANR